MPASDLMHPQHCLAATLRQTTRAANAFYQQFLDVPEGQSTQFTLLAAINGFGRCTQRELAAWLGMDPTTLTRSLALLVEAGLVDAEPGATDRRTRVLTLSAAGRSRLQRLLPEWRAAQAAAVERLGPAKSRRLLALLRECQAALAELDG